MAEIKKREQTNDKTGTVTVSYVWPYKDETGTWKKATFKTKDEAKRFKKVTEDALDKGTHVSAAATYTIADAATAYLTWLGGKEANKEANTIASYRSLINKHIVPHIGKKTLREANNAPAIEAFKQKLLAKPIDLTLDGAGRVLVQLRCIIKRAILDGKTAHNAAREVTVARPDVNEDGDEEILKGEVIPVEKVKALLEAAKAIGNEYPDAYYFLLILANCGLRSSEIRALRWAKGKEGDKDRIPGLDLKAGTLTVCKAADLHNNLGKCKTKAAYRTIPLAPKVVEDLKQWELRCPQGFTTVRIKRGGGNNCYVERTFDQNPLGLVFPNNQGRVKNKTLAPNVIRYNRWIPLLVAIGAATETGKTDAHKRPIYDLDYGLHALRHYCASVWIEDLYTEKEITEYLGHADFSFTLKCYAKLFDRRYGAAKEKAQEQAARSAARLYA